MTIDSEAQNYNFNFSFYRDQISEKHVKTIVNGIKRQFLYKSSLELCPPHSNEQMSLIAQASQDKTEKLTHKNISENAVFSRPITSSKTIWKFRSRHQINTITDCPHSHRKYYSKGMCRKCYHNFGRTKLATECCHTDKPSYAKNVCKRCYQNSYLRMKRARLSLCQKLKIIIWF